MRRNTRHKAAAYDIIIEKHREKLAAHPRIWVKFHYKAGWLHYHAGDAPRARSHLFEALRKDPAHVKSWAALLIFETVGRAGSGLHRRLSAWLRSRKRWSASASSLPGGGAAGMRTL